MASAITVREVPAGETGLVAAALLALRPAYGAAEALVARVDDVLRPSGYRVAGAFEEGSSTAAAALGFRLQENLAWGRFLYVDDLSTLPGHRGRGLARELVRWVSDEAERLGCDQLHLDSGTQAERAPAHALYFRSGMRISSYHFSREL